MKRLPVLVASLAVTGLVVAGALALTGSSEDKPTPSVDKDGSRSFDRDPVRGQAEAQAAMKKRAQEELARETARMAAELRKTSRE